MPDLFEIIAAIPTQELDGRGNLVDVMAITARTLEHDVAFTFTVEKTAGWRDAALAKAREETIEIESVFGTHS